MKKTVYQYYVFVIAPLIWISPCLSQNLVPNPSFETNVGCPTTPGDIDLAVPWTDGNSSADYFHICNPGQQFGIPQNYHGIQWPFSGVAYAGLVTRWPGDNFREYLVAPLIEPLIADSVYLVSFYVSPADDRCRTLAFGAFLSQIPPVFIDEQVLEYTPQVEEYGEYIGDYDSWTLISGCFTAEGGEEYITIGNFRSVLELPPDPTCVQDPLRSYYYVDEVSVYLSSTFETSFVLDPVEACDSFKLYPGVANEYLWEDGSTDPILTITQSGTYQVTLTTACNIQYGQIEITIIPTAPPVVLPQDTLLCAGDVLEIAMDEGAGDYVWQDNMHGGAYIISGPGVYAVSLTDVCETTSDTIVVEFADVPAFSLGEDTVICNSEAFTIALDPDFGEFTWHNGNNDSSFTIDGDGIYALTVTNLCGDAEDFITVDYVEPLDFSIGPEQAVLCAGDIIEIELDPDLGEFLWSDGSTGNTYTVSGEGFFSVEVSNACETVSDEMIVTILQPPEFDLGPDLTGCSVTFPIIFDLSGVAYAEEWEWTGGVNQSLFEITGSGVYSVTVSNACFAESDTITIDEVTPVIILPTDQVLCPGQTLVLDGGGLLGAYQWQDFSSADTFLVTGPGTYSLTVTNICGAGSDSVIVDYIPALTAPDLGADFSLCPGETGVLYAGVENVNYLWSEGTTGTVGTADSLAIASPGTYSVQIADVCTSASDTVIVTFNANPPDVDLPDTLDLCQGDSIVIEAGITGVQYLWEDGTQLSSVIVSSTGIYALTVSNTCGSDTDSVLVDDAGTAPLVSLGDDILLCSGDTVTVIPQSLHVESWLWHDSTTASSIDISAAGIIHVQGVNQCGTALDTLIVTMLPDAPTLDLGADLSLCPGETVTLSITWPDVNIVWHDASADSTYVITEEGIVHATISNACGSSSDTVVVELLLDVLELDLGVDQPLCPGETIIFDPGIADVEYLWQDGSDASTYQTNVPGLIILTISSACGASTDSVLIAEDTNGPQLDLGPDILACEGDTVVLQSGISGVTYLWQDGSGAAHFIAVQSGIYHLQVSNACGIDTDTIEVDMHGTIPTPALDADTSLCEGEVLELISHADSETSVVWQDGSLLSEFVVSQSGTYSLFETNHCGSGTDTIVISYEAGPEAFDLGEDIVLCPGDSVALTAPSTTTLITWHDGSHDAVLVADQEQIYSLQLSNDCGITSDEVSVSFDDDIPELSLDPSISLCDDEVIVLDATQPFAVTYTWSTGSILPSIQVTTPGDYSVSVSTSCYTVNDSVEVISDADCNHTLFIPNAFSPNGDNVNDEWMIVLNDPEITGVQCQIFDRWGNLIFVTESSPIVWDGKFNNQEMLPG
ncbi:MAG TPA: gliding motility-associated C-terminal domain-containing protein, partial [Saprospiraceae bacterium]|nr:gliding motility-associated C-terminal domain-containing protein [Saprospiraceae bacterium]